MFEVWSIGEHTWLGLAPPARPQGHYQQLNHYHGSMEKGTRQGTCPCARDSHHTAFVYDIVLVSNSDFSGTGTFYYANGSMYNGQWDANAKIGDAKYLSGDGVMTPLVRITPFLCSFAQSAFAVVVFIQGYTHWRPKDVYCAPRLNH